MGEICMVDCTATVPLVFQRKETLAVVVDPGILERGRRSAARSSTRNRAGREGRWSSKENAALVTLSSCSVADHRLVLLSKMEKALVAACNRSRMPPDALVTPAAGRAA